MRIKMLNLYPSQSEESNLKNEPTDDELKKIEDEFLEVGSAERTGTAGVVGFI